MQRFWVSWIESEEDFRPLTYPPNEAIIGWWCSGYTEKNEATLCACVDAENQTAALEAIDRDWPGKKVWRFLEFRPSDWVPGDRFPLSDWMSERFKVSLSQEGVSE